MDQDPMRNSQHDFGGFHLDHLKYQGGSFSPQRKDDLEIRESRGRFSSNESQEENPMVNLITSSE